MAVTLYRQVGKGKARRYQKVNLGRGRRPADLTGPYFLRYSLADGTRPWEHVGDDLDEALAARERKEAYFEALAANVPVVQDQDDAGRTKITDAVYQWFAELQLFQGKDQQGKSEKTLRVYNYRLGFFLDFTAQNNIGVGLAEAVKFSASLFGNRFQLAQEVSVRFPVSVRKNQIVRLGIPLSHSALDLPNKFRRYWNESVLGGLLFLLPLEAEMAPRLRLHVQRTFSPVEVSVLGVLHLGVTKAGIQKESVEQFLFFIHSRKRCFEFLLRVGLRRLLGIVEFRQDFAGNENVPCTQERVQRLEHIVNRAIVQIALVVSQEFDVAQKLLAVDLIEVAQMHEEGVSVNTIRIRLGHESLDVTLAYLKGKDAESEEAQEHANSSSLALYA